MKSEEIKMKNEEARTFARNAKGVRELLSMKFDTIPFVGAR